MTGSKLPVGRSSTWLMSLLVGSIVPIGLLTAWEITTRTEYFPKAIVASPGAVIVNLSTRLADGSLLYHSAMSLRRLLIGFVLGSVWAIVLGLFVGASRWGQRLVHPTALFLSPVPVSAWIPALIAVAGIDELSKVLLLSMSTFYVVYFATVNGVRSVDTELVEVAKVCGKNRWELVSEVLLPWATDTIVKGMRSALGICWVVLIVAEAIASSNGLGWMIWDSRNFARSDDMIVGMIAVGILGAATDQLLGILNKWLVFWRPAFEGES